jgi:hypothetical protein
VDGQEDATVLAEFAQSQLRSKRDELERPLTCRLSAQPRFMLT